MTGKEHINLFGIQYAFEFIQVAENNVSEVIAIEKHTIAIDMYNKTLVNDCDNDELKNEKLKKYTVEMNPNLMEFTQSDLSQVGMAKRYMAYHAIGMAFEILFKTGILLDGNDFTHTHKISTLYAELQSLKTEFKNIIIAFGWQTADHFTTYLDNYYTNPDNKYFETYLTFNDKHEHPKELINLFNKISECLVKYANENNVKKPTNWTYPIRLLSR